MQHISDLIDILKKNFDIDKRTLTCVASMVYALLQMRTVNMKQLAPAMAHDIKPDR